MSTWHPIEADSYNEGYKDGKRDVVSELRSLISTGVLATGAGIHGWEIKLSCLVVTPILPYINWLLIAWTERRMTMPKIVCARIECKFCQNFVCKARAVRMDDWAGETLYNGRQQFLVCNTYEKSESARDIELLVRSIFHTKGE